MEYVVMAGGKGVRANCPEKYIQKVLLKDTNGKSLIENILDNHRLYSKSEKIDLLTGFLHDDVQKEVDRYKEKYESKEIELKYNKDFEIGILDSVQKGLEDIDDSVVIINGDTYYPQQAFEVLNDVSESTLVVLPKSDIYEDCIKVLAKDGEIVKLGKELEDYTHISVGSLYLTKEHLSIVKDVLAEIAPNKDYKPKIWHNLVNELIAKGQKIYIAEITNQDHYEIDTEDDYNKFLKRE